MKNRKTRPSGFAPLLKVNASISLIHIFMVIVVALIVVVVGGHGHKGNFKETFCHKKWNNNVKR